MKNSINLDKYNIRTDLIIENINNTNNKVETEVLDNITITTYQSLQLKIIKKGCFLLQF